MKKFTSLKESLYEGGHILPDNENIKIVYDISQNPLTRFDLIDMIFKMLYFRKNLTDQQYDYFYNFLHELSIKQLIAVSGLLLQEQFKTFEKIEREME